ncbi:MAG: hypothetical protein AAGE89_16075 [Pseudomonadota bacterium]
MTLLSLQNGPKIAIVLAALVAVSGCSAGGYNFDDDPDLLTDQDEIPNRPGILETLGGEELSIEL